MPRRTPRVVALAGIVALLLTGCAGLRPGVAAEVAGENLTSRRVDDFAAAFCTYYAKAVQPGEQVSKERRDQALSALVEARLAHEYADKNDVTWNHAQIENTLKGVETAVASLPDDESKSFVDEVRYILEGNAILGQAIGNVSDQAAFNEARTKLVGDWADEFGVEVDPRYGTWSGAQVDGKSGSLSVPMSDESATPGDVSGLPASQTCD